MSDAAYLFISQGARAQESNLAARRNGLLFVSLIIIMRVTFFIINNKCCRDKTTKGTANFLLLISNGYFELFSCIKNKY